jgi:hypothetical protein
VIYLENSEELKTLFPKGTSNVSYFGKYGWSIYECKMPEDVFWKEAQRYDWKMEPIQRPVKMIRYNYHKTSDQNFQKQIDTLTPETETSNSCFHFVKEGYYYILEEKPIFYHVAYESKTNMLYVYSSSTESGQTFYMSILDPSYHDSPPWKIKPKFPITNINNIDTK